VIFAKAWDSRADRRRRDGDLPLEDLAGEALGELGGDGDDARILVRRDALLDMVADLLVR